MIKLSRTNRMMRIFSGILSVVFALGGAGLLLYNNITAGSIAELGRHIKTVPSLAAKTTPILTNTALLLEQQNFWILVVSVSGFIFSLGILVFSLRRSITAYLRYIKKLERVPQPGRFTLDKLAFPEDDEFGNLGHHLNLLIRYIKSFEQQRDNMRLIEHNRFQRLVRETVAPVICIDKEHNILQNNLAFHDQFFLNDESYHRTLFGTFSFGKSTEESLPVLLQKLFNSTLPEAELQETVCQVKHNRFLCDIKLLPVNNAEGRVAQIMLLFQEVRFQGPADRPPD